MPWDGQALGRLYPSYDFEPLILRAGASRPKDREEAVRRIEKRANICIIPQGGMGDGPANLSHVFA
jgi:hypothetical protein